MSWILVCNIFRNEGSQMETHISDQKSSHSEFIDDRELPDLDALQEGIISKRKVFKFIENLEISADLKALLFSMTETAITIGEVLLPIGRVVISFAIELAKLFPALTFAVVFAKLLPAIAAAGIIKVGLAKLIAPLLPMLGAYVDYEGMKTDNRLQNMIDRIASKFFPSNHSVSAI